MRNSAGIRVLLTAAFRFTFISTFLGLTAAFHFHGCVNCEILTNQELECESDST
jgi:hypothetical protein